MIDLLASEPHFADHLAAIWPALRDRGQFLVPPALVDRARSHDVEPTAVEGLGGPSESMGPADRADIPVLVASYGDVKRARAMGRRSIAFIEHGIGQAYPAGGAEADRHGSYAGGSDRDDVSLFLVPNEYSAARWRVAYPDAAVEIVGCPKLDTLPGREPGPGPVVAITFHWPASLLPETHPAYPHYAAVLPSLARRFHVIGHAHPRYWQLAKTYARMGVPFVERFEDVCRQADVLTFDNSSAGYEFAATGRPVVVMNSPEYRRYLRHGLRFWDAADVGIQVDEPRDLIAAVELALADGPEQRANREAALDIVYAHRTGAAERAAAVLGSWVSSRKHLVAA